MNFPAERLSYLSNPAGLADAQNKYLEALASVDGRITEACEIADVTWRQVQRWRENADFKSRETEVKERRNDKDRKQIHRLMDEGNERVLVKRMDSLPEYRKESRVTVEGSVEHNHHLDNMTPAQILELLDKGREAIELERAQDGTFGGDEDEVSESDLRR